MLDKVRDYIIKEKMICSGDTVLAAVSGGMDSVVLLDILSELRVFFGFELKIIHFFHKVRRYGCEGDLLFVESLGEEKSIPVVTGAEDIPLKAREEKKSLEEAGREGRYDFFYNVIQKTKNSKIATAHSANDQVETILMRLIRGTGLRGLSGIPPVREGVFIRPLLNITRKEIKAYAFKKNLSYRDDQTNKDRYFLRNRVRQELIPLLKKGYNPSLTQGILQLCDLSREDEAFLNSIAEERVKKLVSGDKSESLILSLDEFFSCHLAIKRRIIRIILHKLTGQISGITYEIVKNILDLSEGETGKIFNFSSFSARKEYNRLIFSPHRKKSFFVPYEKEINFPGETVSDFFGIKAVISIKDFSSVPSGENRFYAEFDAEKINSPLFLRNRRKGDRFTPLGLKGKKKIKKFFIDEKVPSSIRDRIPLISTEKDIIWVVGMRINEFFKVTPKTKKVISINIEKI